MKHNRNPVDNLIYDKDIAKQWRNGLLIKVAETTGYHLNIGKIGFIAYTAHHDKLCMD